jgi:hypothetical protein
MVAPVCPTRTCNPVLRGRDRELVARERNWLGASWSAAEGRYAEGLLPFRAALALIDDEASG